MRLPHRLAACEAVQQRNSCVGEIVERQHDCRRQMSGRRDQKQEPAEQQADRQTADVAEEEPGDRPIEIGKTEHCSAKRQRHDHSRRRQGAEPSDHGQRRRDRHDLGDRHPIEAVHEIYEVDEPQPADDEQDALGPPRHERHDAQFMWECVNHERDRQRLQQQAGGDRDRANVIGGAHARDQNHGSEHEQQRLRGDSCAGPKIQGAVNGNDCRCDDRNAAALRRRYRMRRARVRFGQRIALKQRAQNHDQQRAEDRRERNDRRRVKPPGPALTGHDKIRRYPGAPPLPLRPARRANIDRARRFAGR